jgi:hypothetical protein
MDEFESLYWDLTQVAAWALTREPDAVRTSADRSNENALFEVRAAHLARWWEVNALLWIESGWTVPASVAAVEIIAGGVADEVTMIPSLSDERYAARLRQLQAEGKIRMRQDDTFPINDYLRALFQTDRLAAYHYRTVDAGAHAIPPTDWAFLEIVGGDHERLTIRRIGEQGERGHAIGDLKVPRGQVLAVFPAVGEPRTEAAKQQVQQKKKLPHLVAVALGRLYGAERPTVDREEMRHAVTAEIHRTVSMKTLDRAIKLTWPSASPNRAKSGPDPS